MKTLKMSLPVVRASDAETIEKIVTRESQAEADFDAELKEDKELSDTMDNLGTIIKGSAKIQLAITETCLVAMRETAFMKAALISWFLIGLACGKELTETRQLETMMGGEPAAGA